MRGNHLSNHQYSTSDGVGPYFSSPSEISPARQWTPPAIQEIKVDDYGTSSRRGNMNLLGISLIIFDNGYRDSQGCVLVDSYLTNCLLFLSFTCRNF